MTIDHRSWDQYQHANRIREDGTIEVFDGELMALRAALWQAKNVPEDQPPADGLITYDLA